MNLKILRNQIDQIDREIIHLLKRRFALVDKIGQLKQEMSKPIIDKNREEKIVKQIGGEGPHTEAITKVFNHILKESRRIQKTKRI